MPSGKQSVEVTPRGFDYEGKTYDTGEAQDLFDRRSVILKLRFHEAMKQHDKGRTQIKIQKWVESYEMK